MIGMEDIVGNGAHRRIFSALIHRELRGSGGTGSAVAAASPAPSYAATALVFLPTRCSVVQSSLLLQVWSGATRGVAGSNPADASGESPEGGGGATHGRPRRLLGADVVRA